MVIEDVRGDDAQELADMLPKLVVLEGSERTAVAGPAREHPHLLEKVRLLLSRKERQMPLQGFV